MNSCSNRIARLCVALATLVVGVNSPAALACTDVLKHAQPSGDIGKVIIWLAVFVGFVVVLLTWIPDWISPASNTSKRNEDKEPDKKGPRDPDFFDNHTPWGN